MPLKKSLGTSLTSDITPKVVFMFTGQGLQQPNMGKQLYKNNAIFRAILDRYFSLTKELLNIDLLAILYPDILNIDKAKYEINSIINGSLISFIFQYSFSILLFCYGLIPDMFVGHSIGEYVAAVLCGVMSFESALKIIYARAKLIELIPDGSMISVPLSKSEILEFLPNTLSLAADHCESCLVSGLTSDIEEFERTLKAKRILSQRLNIRCSGHSHHFKKILNEFINSFSDIPLFKPKHPFVSTCTGYLIQDDQATSPEFWGRHLISTVLINKALETIIDAGINTFIEVGVGNILTGIGIQKDQNMQCVFFNLINIPPDVEEEDDSADFCYEQLKRIAQHGCHLSFYPDDMIYQNNSHIFHLIPFSIKIQDTKNFKKIKIIPYLHPLSLYDELKIIDISHQEIILIQLRGVMLNQQQLPSLTKEILILVLSICKHFTDLRILIFITDELFEFTLIEQLINSNISDVFIQDSKKIYIVTDGLLSPLKIKNKNNENE